IGSGTIGQTSRHKRERVCEPLPLLPNSLSPFARNLDLSQALLLAPFVEIRVLVRGDQDARVSSFTPASSIERETGVQILPNRGFSRTAVSATMHKLLVPVDGSDNAMRALEYAIRLAKECGPTIVIAYAHEPPIVYGELAIYVPPGEAKDLQRKHGE